MEVNLKMDYRLKKACLGVMHRDRNLGWRLEGPSFCFPYSYSSLRRRNLHSIPDSKTKYLNFMIWSVMDTSNHQILIKLVKVRMT